MSEVAPPEAVPPEIGEESPDGAATSAAPMTAGGGNRAVWWVILAGVMVVVLGIVFTSRFGEDPGIVPSPLIGKPAPVFTAPYLGTEGTFDLADHRGDIIVVNFWASWCLACRQEHGALVSAAAAYRSFDVTFVGVNYQDTEANGIAFLDDLGWSAATHYVVDENSRVALQYGVLGLPETFFIDRDGIVVGKVSGPLDATLLNATLDRIILGQAIGSVKTGEVQNQG